MPGRRPKPTAAKRAAGNPGKRKLNKSEAATAGELERPAHLSERAAKAWDHLLPILHKRGLAGDLDAIALEALCECYAELMQLRQLIADEEDGALTYDTMTESGRMVRARPEVGMRADADRRLKAWLIEFGMTPAARSKVQVSDASDKKKDPEEEYFGQSA